MLQYEYKTVPAPRKGEKAKGIKASDGRLALALQNVLNEHGAQGWDYLRAETLPLEERTGLTSKTVSYHTVLVFRRVLPEVDPLDAVLAGSEADYGTFPEEIKDASDTEPSNVDPVEALGYTDAKRGED